MSRILVIDDELPLRRLVRSMLERAGHTVLDAADGLQGVALWRAQSVDVVVTDIFLPVKDGVEVILEMKQALSPPKIIAMSGGGECRDLFQLNPDALMLGADRVLVKPFDREALLSAIEEVLVAPRDTKEAALQSQRADQRKYLRFSISLPVSFGDGVDVQMGTVVDISREGCRIRYADAPPRVKYFRMEIPLDDPPRRLTVDLAVGRWLRNGEFGVEFIRMNPDDQARLRNLIQLCEAACSRQSSGGAQEAPLAVSLKEQTDGWR